MIFRLLILFLIPLGLFAQPFSVSWQKDFDGIKVNSQYYPRYSQTDLFGDLVIAGNKDSGVAFLPFIQKYKSDGTLVFDKLYVVQDGLNLMTLVLDITGKIYIAGWAYMNNQASLYIAKFDSAGNFLWNYSYPADPFNNDIQLAVDSTFNVYFGFSRMDSISNDARILWGKLNPSGGILWTSAISVSNFSSTVLKKLFINNNNRITIFADWHDLRVYQFDSTGVQLNMFSDNSLVSGGTGIVDSSGNCFLIAGDIYQDSTALIMLDSSLNQVWRKYLYIIPDHPLLTVRGNRLYVVGDYQMHTFSCFDYTGNELWTSFVPYGKPVAIHVGPHDRIFVAIDANSMSSNEVGFVEYDTSGAQLMYRLYFGYFYQTSSLNEQSQFYFGYSSGSYDQYHYNVFGCDTAIQDTFRVEHVNYQSKNDKAYKVLTDQNGDVVVIGSTSDTLSYPLTYGHYPSLLFMKYDSQGNHLWNANVHLTSWGYFEVNKLVIDNQNNIYVCGNSDSSGYPDAAAFLVKVNSAGQVMWRYFYYDSLHIGYNDAYSLAVDSNGNVYLCGYPSINSPQQRDGLLVKLDPSGNEIWVKKISVSPGSFNSVFDLVFEQDKIFILITSSLPPTTGRYYINELDTSGTVVRQFYAGNNRRNYFGRLLIDSEKNFVCYGYDADSITNEISWYVIKLDSTGNFLNDWKGFSIASSYSQPEDAVLDANNNIYLTGGVLSGNTIIYRTVKLNPDCQLAWVDGSSQASRGTEIYFADGNIYSLSDYWNDSNCAFVSVYDTSGAILFRDTFPDNGNNYPYYGLSVQANGFYVAGSIYSDSAAQNIFLRKYERINVKIPAIGSSNELGVYPNPTDGKVQILFPEMDRGKKHIQLLSITGAILYSRIISESPATKYINVNLPYFSSGTYVLSVSDEQGRIYTQKIVIGR